MYALISALIAGHWAGGSAVAFGGKRGKEPTMGNYRSGNGGHSPGHVRDTFLSAIEAYLAWEQSEPEPTVDFDEARPITISQACEMVWNCSDILPSGAVDSLDQCGLELSRRTYAAAARALLPAIKDQLAAWPSFAELMPAGIQQRCTETRAA
jgi:hypothetical protein